ncbi:MAG: helix-turn-helix domain-containing protein [Pseudomonadota bacterium]
MLRKSRDDLDNPLSLALQQVGDAWMLMIIWSAVRGVSRFDDFQRELGVARNILAERLRRLVDCGIMEKTPISVGARRLEYRLTDKGMDLEETLSGLSEWGSRWGAANKGEALQAAE